MLHSRTRRTAHRSCRADWIGCSQEYAEPLYRANFSLPTKGDCMSDPPPIYSPDQRFFISLGSNEVRMSHWINCASLCETQTQRVLLGIGKSMWSAEKIVWQADSSYVSIETRRYPGDAPTLLIDIYPNTQVVVSHEPGNPTPPSIPFRKLNSYLERYYKQHRSSTTPTDQEFYEDISLGCLAKWVRWLFR